MMKKILIISPHFPPSNLVGVHRARFLSMHLPTFGWEPIILTVDEKYYEEELDWDLYKLIPKHLSIEKVKALKITKPRIVGDIGLRAFWSIFKRAKEIIVEREVDFLYITIPSFYGALWGRWLHKVTGIAYGIDFQDPWVHRFPGQEKTFSRAWLAAKTAEILEPIAVKKASLITGASEGYYRGVVERNPQLQTQCLFAAMPIGIEPTDFDKIKLISKNPYLFKTGDDKVQLIYAGAMLPKAYPILERVFESIQKNENTFQNVEFYFIGTGKSPDDKTGYNIKPMAEKWGLWEKQVFEYPARIPYLDVLVHLNEADGVFILGSTEPHYTPSKVYQAVLSKKPVFAILHSESTAVAVIRQSHTGIVLNFNGEKDLERVSQKVDNDFQEYLKFMSNYAPERVDWSYFDEFSAKEITRILAEKLDELCPAPQNAPEWSEG